MTHPPATASRSQHLATHLAGVSDPSADTLNPRHPTIPQKSDTETLGLHPAFSSPPSPPSPITESLPNSHHSQRLPRPNTKPTSRRLRSLRHHLKDRFHLLSAELQNLEWRRMEMERDVREDIGRDGFEGFDERLGRMKD